MKAATAERVYTTVNGREIAADFTPEVEEYVRRVKQLAANPAATANDVIALVYSVDNPVMERVGSYGRGVVTARVLTHPAYRVMTDILFRKEVQERGADLQTLADQYSLTVPEAAERFGVHVSAVRQAVDSGRLGAWMKAGEWYIDPRSLATFEFAPGGRNRKKRASRKVRQRSR